MKQRCAVLTFNCLIQNKHFLEVVFPSGAHLTRATLRVAQSHLEQPSRGNPVSFNFVVATVEIPHRFTDKDFVVKDWRTVWRKHKQPSVWFVGNDEELVSFFKPRL